MGHAAACLAVFITFRVTAGNDFAIMGSLFAGRLYLFGAAWLMATVAMAVLIGLCSLMTGLHLRGLMDGPSSEEEKKA